MAGRKRIDIDYKQLDKLLGLQSTLKECAFYFDCSEDTIERAIKRDKGMSFNEYREIKRQAGFISLRRNQFQLAEKNPSMAIFLGKNYLGQTDKFENNIQMTQNQKLDFSGLSTEEIRKILNND